MIDEKKLHKEIGDWFKSEICSGRYEIDTVDASAEVRRIIDKQPKVGEWIPIRFRETTDEDDIDKEEYPMMLDCPRGVLYGVGNRI